MVSLNAWALYLSRLRLTYNLTIISPRLDTGFLLGITRLGVSPNYLICTEPAHHNIIILLACKPIVFILLSIFSISLHISCNCLDIYNGGAADVFLDFIKMINQMISYNQYGSYSLMILLFIF